MLHIFRAAPLPIHGPPPNYLYQFFVKCYEKPQIDICSSWFVIQIQCAVSRQTKLSKESPIHGDWLFALFTLLFRENHRTVASSDWKVEFIEYPQGTFIGNQTIVQHNDSSTRRKLHNYAYYQASVTITLGRRV